MLQNAPNCTIKIFLGGDMPLNPPNKRVASQAPPPKKNSWSPLPNPAYAHELPLRNLFENPPW